MELPEIIEKFLMEYLEYHGKISDNTKRKREER